MSSDVTWLGHASAVVRLGDQRILIDPLGRRRARSIAAPSAIAITHSHVDHLNRWTLKSLDRGVPLLVPKGARHIVEDLGFRELIEMEPGDHVSLGGVDILAVETRHDNGRWKKGDRPICVGYIFQKNGIIVHHAGDVDMSDFSVFDDLGKRHKITTTLLPIGGMLPPGFYERRRERLDQGVHICPRTALGIAERMGAQTMVPVHWGTVNLRLFHRASAPKDRLLQAAEEAGLENLVKVLGHGEALALKVESTTRSGSDDTGQ